MKCSYCGEEIEDGLEVCPFCNGEVSSEVQKPTTKEDSKDPQDTAPKEPPADKSKEQRTAQVAPVKSSGRGALVGIGVIGAIALIGCVVLGVLFVKTSNELAEAKVSIEKLEYQLAVAKSASSSSNEQADTSALPSAPTTYKGTVDGISWEAYKYRNNQCVVFFEPSQKDIGSANLEFRFKDANGKLISAKNEFAVGMTKGKKYFEDIYDAGDFYDLEISYSEGNLTSKGCNVSETHTVKGKKVIADVTNNGPNKASQVGVGVLFTKNGEVVDFKSAYTNSDLEVGSSVAREVTTDQDFDLADVYTIAYGN